MSLSWRMRKEMETSRPDIKINIRMALMIWSLYFAIRIKSRMSSMEISKEKLMRSMEQNMQQIRL